MRNRRVWCLVCLFMMPVAATAPVAGAQTLDGVLEEGEYDYTLEMDA